LLAISDRFAAFPQLTEQTPDELLYDEHGVHR
jgi:hypothetical protein